MTKAQWDHFFDLLELIMQLPGTWQDKKATVESEAEERGSQSQVEEFANWFES